MTCVGSYLFFCGNHLHRVLFISESNIKISVNSAQKAQHIFIDQFQVDVNNNKLVDVIPGVKICKGFETAIHLNYFRKSKLSSIKKLQQGVTDNYPICTY